MDPIRISAPAFGVGAVPGLPDPGPGGTGAALEAARGFAALLSRAEVQGTAAVTGGTDPHDLMAAISESRLAVETVVAVRDKAVESYQEILRMPV